MQESSFWETFFTGLENSSFALLFRQSAWLYPAVEIVHITGFVLLVGAAVMYDLRLIGLSRRLSVRNATRHLTVWARLSLIAVIPSGLILFTVDASSLASNSAFQIKLILIAAAGINATMFHQFTLKSVDSWDQETAPPPAARIAGVTSILLWFSVIVCGRLIAYV